ncbi:hypothetical protein BKA83DRAFT_4498274 [Pisolithus microcarpus]|nr:hypothetical protein BKA83DRAFT_4498274 [Pisolithus microcarpus]
MIPGEEQDLLSLIKQKEMQGDAEGADQDIVQFWMQDAIGAQDDELVGNLNRFLADLMVVPIWNAGDGLPSQQMLLLSDLVTGSSSESREIWVLILFPPSHTAFHPILHSPHQQHHRYHTAQAAAPPTGLTTAKQLAHLHALVMSMSASSMSVGVHANLIANVDANASVGPNAFDGRSSWTEGIHSPSLGSSNLSMAKDITNLTKKL